MTSLLSEARGRYACFADCLEAHPSPWGRLALLASAVTVVALLGLPSGSEAALTAGHIKRLTRGRETDSRASWSPDGKSVVFVSGREGGKNLWIVRFETNEVVRATDFTLPSYADQPCWSPTRQEIVFTSNRAGGAPDLWLLNLDTNEQKQLTADPSVDWMPTFSPDGNQIAFVSDRSGTDSVWIMNRDGGEARKLVDNAWDPAWSPDGASLAFRSLDRDKPGVAVVSVSGGKPVVVAPKATNPTWSPDGRRLCVVSRSGTREELELVNADGSRPVSLPQLGQSPRSPRWSHDGSRLIYDALADGRRNLFVLTLDYRVPEVKVASPAAGGRVQGTVNVTGTIAVPYGKLDHAVVEVGPGAFPTNWQQLGDVIHEPRENSLLAVWNTEGLTGAYTLRVTAVDSAGDAGIARVQVHVLSEHGVEFTQVDVPGTMTAGQVYSVPVTLKNVGTMTWLDAGHYQVEVGYRWLDASQTVVIRKGLLTPLPHSVESGQSISLEAQVKAPPLPGRHTLELDLRQGDILWFSDRNALTYRATVNVVVPLSVKYLADQTPKQMTPGQVYTVTLRLLNDGAGPWQTTGEPKVAVGYHWLDETGARLDIVPLLTDLPNTVMPDDEVSVAARVRAPEVTGEYRLQWDLVINEERWLTSDNPKAGSPLVNVTVKGLDGVAYGAIDVPRSMAPGQLYVASVPVRNSGLLTWKAAGRNRVRLGYHWLDAGGRQVQQQPVLASLPGDVPADKSVVLAAQVQAPAAPGEYTLEWDLLKGEDDWFSEHGSRPATVSVLVARPTYAVGFSCTDHPARMIVGQPYLVNITLKNKGMLTWAADEPHAVALSYHWLDRSGAELSESPLRVSLPRDVPYGQSVSVAGQVRAPEMPGQYTLKWDLYQEGQGWFSARGAHTLSMPVRVEVLYGVDFISHDTPAAMVAGQRYTVHVRIKNLGVLKWEAQGAVPVQLSYKWLDQKGSAVVPRGFLTNLPKDVEQGETVDLQAQLRAPDQPGTYILKWDLLQGGMLWFAEKGAKPLQVVVKVG